MNSTPAGWTILVPVKATTRGKSRLDVPAEVRRRLALAMALDTIAVAAQCGSVVAVVDDGTDSLALASIAGVRIHLSRVTGLNESILDCLTARGRPGVADITGQVAVLPADLPGVRPAELAGALTLMSVHRFAVVSDHQGVGTTLLAATAPAALQPRYGPDSFRRHQEAGATPIELPASSTVRWDVDTVADLYAADLGTGIRNSAGPHSSLGPRTRDALDSSTAGRAGS